MERLTIRNSDGTVCQTITEPGAVLKRLAAYEDTGLMPEDVARLVSSPEAKEITQWLGAMLEGDSVMRMAYLWNADKEGRLVVLKEAEKDG